MTILVNIRVYVNITQHRMELFNEVILLNLLYCIMCFSDMVEDVEAQYKVGYVACALVALHFAVNLFRIIWTSIKGIILKARMRNFRKTHTW